MSVTRREVVIGAPLAMAFAASGHTAGLKVQATTAGATLSADGHVLTRNAQPSLAWRYAGELEWRSTPAVKFMSTPAGEGIAMVAEFPECRAELLLQPDSENSWLLASSLVHTGKRPLELARFHQLEGSIQDPALGLLMLQGLTTQRLIRRGEGIPAFAGALTDLWASMKVRWTVGVDPVYGEADWALSRDIGFLTSDWNAPAWGAGFTGPGMAFGELGFRTSGDRRFFIGQVLDNILFEPGETRSMDNVLLWHGDWQDGLKRWIARCAQEFAVAKPGPAPAGYCSWYQRGQRVELADMERANSEFSAWPKPRGGRLIQIDDGYQNIPGDWQPNVKFAGRWAQLAAGIAGAGSIPGTYLAPTTIHESHPLVKAQPQMLQRLPDGSMPISFANWGGNTYYVEPDHPLSRDFMRRFFIDARNDGWKYIKIDFTYGLSTARAAYDRKLTSLQTLRNLYSLFRETAGPEMQLNACIGEVGRYALGLVDAARIGGDISAKWPTVKSNLINVLLFAPTNGTWWQADPDVFYMRTENSGLSAEESFVLTGTLGLMGGLFLTSDLPSQWSPDAQALVRQFWNEASPVAPVDQRIVVSNDGVMQAYRVSYGPGQPARHRLAIYNWGDAAQTLKVNLRDARVPEPAAWRIADRIYGKGMTLVGGTLISTDQPPHSLRIADLVGLHAGNG